MTDAVADLLVPWLTVGLGLGVVLALFATSVGGGEK